MRRLGKTDSQYDQGSSVERQTLLRSPRSQTDPGSREYLEAFAARRTVRCVGRCQIVVVVLQGVRENREVIWIGGKTRLVVSLRCR